MSENSTIHLQRLHGRLGELVYEMMKLRFSHFKPAAPWTPSINVYRCQNRIAVCADLSGTDKNAIEIKAEPHRLFIRGRRPAPEPDDHLCAAVHVLAMEIDYGSFERELVLSPLTIDPSGVTATHVNGWLWIYLPVRPEA